MASKPDYIDIDKDGNKKESMKAAAKQAKSKMKKGGKVAPKKMKGGWLSGFLAIIQLSEEHSKL